MRNKSYYLISLIALALIILSSSVLADTQMTGSFQGYTATINNPAGGQKGTWVIACIYTMKKPLNVGVDQTLIYSERIYVEDGETLYKDYSGFPSQYDCHLQFDIAEENSCPQPPYFNGANLFAFTFSGGPYCPDNPVCGNGIWETGEDCEHENECNDGNSNTIDTCDSCECFHTPKNNPVCGDGVVTSPEQCENNAQCNDNNAGTTDTCNACQCSHTNNPVCGDGVVTPPEQCETNAQCNDNNPTTTDTCSACQCSHTSGPFCGDGQVTSGETCEPPNSNNNGACSQTTTTCSGTRTGVRDGFGTCDSVCGCVQDQFQFSCVLGSCGATCATNADCNDNNPLTSDICDTNTCGCTNVNLPTCGDGTVTPPEQCETNAQCPSGQTCNSCVCSGSPVCGNAVLNAGEQCDFGAAINGIPCVPPLNGACTYCTTNCTFASVTGNSCGNSIVDYGEQCDEGASNGALCSTVCDDFCTYCNSQCQVSFVDGGTCYGNITPPGPPSTPPPTYPCGGYNCPIPVPPRGPTPRASICGDGIIGIGEECDFGYENGIACSASCNSQCNYCDATCHSVTVDGGACVRKARPWDLSLASECRIIQIPPTNANLDVGCSGGGLDVLKAVNLSDNNDARQQACSSNPSYIYLSWLDLQYTQNLRNISVYLEHEEENSYTELQYYNGTGWQKICSIPRADVDNLDSCELKRITTFENVSLRIRISRQGTNSVEKVDQAYLGLEYCGTSICGNRNLNPGQPCDDSVISESDLICGEFGACIDGQQTQVCYFGNYVKTNLRKCGSAVFFESFFVIILIFLLILLLLFFLFFPAIYFALTQKKKKK